MLSRRVVRWLLVAVVVIVVFWIWAYLIGPKPTNPPVMDTGLVWDSPETEATMRAACYDCHSNETVWPFYAYLAPVSWLVINDVNEGREELNFSTGRGEMDARELIEVIESGEMPLPIYLPLHPEANLSDAQKAALIAGIRASTLRG